MSESKKSRVASITIDGKWVNVVVQTAMITMLVHATVPTGDIYDHLSGELLDPQLVQDGRESESVRACDSSVCTDECRGTKQLERGFESSCWTIANETQMCEIQAGHAGGRKHEQIALQQHLRCVP